MRFIPCLAALLFAFGCSSIPEKEKPPQHAKRVEALMYDPSHRAQAEKVEVFDETRAIHRPHKAIALLTCEGTAKEEVAMTQAIIYRARMMGADALVILPRNHYATGDSSRMVYRGNAVVYDK